ncbi:hypothetical protein OIU74_012396 [Salix koriyanagi]|uniref:Uncharacterized protein n=1 Tax=Salix koriyanagi TaxID=2511006 RepID=A0A9Q0Q710_9ROSI|nr:hypothetical protein OIU74_012396 [Salix koriyanagi]
MYATGARFLGILFNTALLNGDPNYDLYLASAVAVLKPNEAAFEKEIEGLPSTRPVGDLPPELHCPL